MQVHTTKRVMGGKPTTISEADSRRSVQFGRNDSGRVLDSNGTKPSAGLALAIYRSERLDSATGKVGAQLVQQTWPGLDVDRFSDGENSKLEKFNTRWASPMSPIETSNALAQSWKNSFSYACPPMAMIDRVLRLIKDQKVRCVIICPNWVSANDERQSGAIGKWRGDVSTGSVGRVQPNKKSKMAIFSGRGGRKQVPAVNWDGRAAVSQYVFESFAGGTLNQNASHARNYETNYCATLGKKAWPLEMETVEEFMAWLIHTNRPGSLKGAWTALQHHQQTRGHKAMQKSRQILKLEQKAEKVFVERGDKPRDPFLASMAKDFCLQMNSKSRADVRDAAIITAGMRGMLRSSEIVGLKFKHIEQEDRAVVIDLIMHQRYFWMRQETSPAHQNVFERGSESDGAKEHVARRIWFLQPIREKICITRRCRILSETQQEWQVSILREYRVIRYALVGPPKR